MNATTIEVLRHVYKVRRKLLMLCVDADGTADVTTEPGERKPNVPDVRWRLSALASSFARAQDSDHSASEQEESDASVRSSPTSTAHVPVINHNL